MRKVVIDSSDCEDFDTLTDRVYTTWQGRKNGSMRSKYITDGSMLINKKRVSETDLFDELCDRIDENEKADNDSIRSLMGKMDREKKYVAVLRGHVETPYEMANVNAVNVAAVSYRNYKEHVLVDAHAMQLVERIIVRGCDMVVGKNTRILQWRKKDTLIAALASWRKIDLNID